MIDQIAVPKSRSASPEPTAAAAREETGASAIGFTDYLDGQITKKPAVKKPDSNSEQESEEGALALPDMPDMPPEEVARSGTGERLAAAVEGPAPGPTVPDFSLQTRPAGEPVQIPQSAAASEGTGVNQSAPVPSENTAAEALTGSGLKEGPVEMMPEMMTAVAQSIPASPSSGRTPEGQPSDAVMPPVFEGQSVGASESLERTPAMQAADAPLPGSAQMDEKSLRFDDLVERFERRLLSMVQQGDKVMRITVQPASMGRLTVSCTEDSSGMSLEIVAQNSGVRDAIVQQEDAIRRLMQEHSVGLGAFDVLLDEGSGGHRQTGDDEVQAARKAPRGIAPASEQEGELHALHMKNRGGAVSLVA